jgi:hypothetical protein
MSSTSRGWSVARWILIGAGCTLMFLLPSALLIDLGLPRWMAGPLGALSFPLAPIAWHVLAERARKRRVAAAKVPPRSTLTTSDRFVLRLVAVALVTCLPWIVLARGRTWSALVDHGAWPVTTIKSLFGGDGATGNAAFTADRRLLDDVPADAEALIWIRGAADLTKLVKPGTTTAADLAPDSNDGFEQGVMALKHGELFFIIRATKIDDSELADLDKKIDQAQARTYFGHDLHFVSHRLDHDTIVVVSKGWDDGYLDRMAGRTRPAQALIELLAATPADAMIVAVAKPREPIADLTADHAVAWITIDLIAKQLVLSATLTAPDAAGAAKIAAGAQAELALAKGKAPASCRDAVGKLFDGIHVTTRGTTVSIDTRVAPEAIVAAITCSWASGPGSDP